MARRRHFLKSGQPYPGLRPFRSDETHIFFGRDDQQIDMLKRLKASRFLAVVGASGCGKSSLVKAGLIPSLRGGMMGAPEGSRWKIALMKPGDRPIERLAASLVKQAKLVEDTPEPIATGLLGARLRRGPLGLCEALDGTPLPEGCNLLIIADQFEEIFRYRDLQNEKQAREADLFVALLLAAAEQQRKLPIFVVLTMRSDFIGECAVFQGLPEAVSRSQFLAPRLTRKQRELAIVGPTRVYGGEVDKRLVTRLLNDTGSAPNQLPILQHALMRMWTLKPADQPGLNLDDYLQKRVGGLGRALSRHADEAFYSLDARQKRIAEIMFRRLCEAANSTRRPTKASEIAELASIDLEAEVSIDRVREVADAFRSAGTNFITPDISDPVDAETVLDISHESLITQWGRLRHWAEDEARSAEEYRLLQQLSRKRELNEQGLLTDEALQTARKWRRTQKPSPLWAKRYDRETTGKDDDDVHDVTVSEKPYERTMRFLDESVRAAAWEFVERRKESKRIEAERKAREVETKRQLSRFRVLSGALVLLLAVVVGVGFWAVQAQQTAAELESKAVKDLVNRFLDDGDVRAGLERVVEALPPPDFRAALEHLWEQPLDGKAWAALGQVGEPLSNTLIALERAVSRHAPRIYRDTPDPAFDSGAQLTALAMSPDQPVLVTADESGKVRLWNMDQKKEPTALDTVGSNGRPSVFHSMRFSRDGKYLAAISGDGFVSVWRAGLSPSDSYEQRLRFDTPFGDRSTRYSIAIAAVPEREGIYRIVVASYRANPQFWTWDSNSNNINQEAVTCPNNDDKYPGSTSIDVSADGRFVASGSWNGFARIWEFGESSCTLRQRSSTRSSGGPPVRSVRFSPAGSGRLLYTSRKDFYLWTIEAGGGSESPTKFEGHDQNVLEATFDPIAQRVVSISTDGTVRLWNAHDRTPLDILYGPKNMIGRKGLVAFSYDGRRIAANFSDDRTFVWDLTTRTLVKPRLLRDRADVTTAALDQQGRRLITAGRGGARVWSIHTARPVRTLPARLGDIVSVAFHPDGHQFLTASESEVQIWDANVWPADPSKETPEYTLPTGDKIAWASYDAAGERILAAYGSAVRVFDARSYHEIMSPLRHQSPIVTGALSMNGRWLVTLTTDRSLHLWDLTTGKKHRPANPPVALPESWSQVELEGASLKIVDERGGEDIPESYILAPHEGKLRIWSWRGENSQEDMDSQLWPIRTRLGLTVLDDGVLQIRTRETGEVLTQIPAPVKRDSWKAIVASRESDYLATISKDGMVRLTWLPSEDFNRTIRIARDRIALERLSLK